MVRVDSVYLVYFFLGGGGINAIFMPIQMTEKAKLNKNVFFGICVLTLIAK